MDRLTPPDSAASASGGANSIRAMRAAIPGASHCSFYVVTAVIYVVGQFQRVQPTRLSAERVALIVRRRANAVGLDPARYAGHSLRAGLATSAAAAGASERVIMSQTGHRSADMVRKYIRGNLFNSNAAAIAGL